MSSTNLDAHDLHSQNLDGVIHEDVMNTIFDVSRIPLPFADRAGVGGHDNQYASWRMDQLAAPTTDGQVVDGSDAQVGNDTKVGRRVGNHSEIRTRRVEVSTRADAVDTIGYASELAYQVTRRQQELRRSVDATALSNNASVRGTDTVAGVTAGLAAWLTDVDVDGVASGAAQSNVHREAGGADGGWDDTVGDSLVAASTPGTVPVAISETNVRDVVEGIYTKGGEPSVLMSSPAVKRRFGEYLFTSSARIATMTNESPGGAARERKAQGSVDLFITDYGVLELTPNRLQPAYDTGNDIAFILDFAFLEISFLTGYMVQPLAKTGLADDRLMSVDWMLKVKNWDACGAVYDIDPTTVGVS